ncbi:hypothetical protein [Profundibacter sp.]
MTVVKAKNDCLPRTALTAREATACDVRGQLAGGAADAHLAGTFECDLWPACGCPDGTHKPDCPGLKGMVRRNTSARLKEDGFDVSIEEIELEMERWKQIAGCPDETGDVISRAYAAVQALRNVKSAIEDRR